MRKIVMGIELELGQLIQKDGKLETPSNFEAQNAINLLLLQEPFILISVQNIGWLTSGGKIYRDHGDHIEIASPECVDLKNMVAYYEASKMLAGIISSRHYLQKNKNEKLFFFANNIDHDLAHTFGFHDNYSVSKKVREEIDDLSSLLLPFFTTRQLFTGAGVISGSDFKKSQRATFLENESSSSTTSQRGIFNTRPESDADEYFRLHNISMDSAILQFPVYLNFGAMSLIINAIELGFLSKEKLDTINIQEPEKAFKAINDDITMSCRLKLKNGQTITATDIQKRYLEITGEMLVKDTDLIPELEDIWKVWEKTIYDLEKKESWEIEELQEKIGWIDKYALLQKAADKYGGWDKKGVKMLDVVYHRIDIHTPGGIIEHRSSRKKIATDEEIKKVMRIPPRTRAENRVNIIAKNKHDVREVDWNYVKLRDGVIFLPSPFLKETQENLFP